MAWLLRDDDVLGSVEVVTDVVGRLRGLARRDCPEGLVMFRPSRIAHTLGARCRIDLVFCDRGLRVVDVVVGLAPYRLVRPRWAARCVIEGETGFAGRCAIGVGDQLELKG